MEGFDSTIALQDISKLVGGIQLKRAEHELLSQAIAMIGQELAQCAPLRARVAELEAKAAGKKPKPKQAK